MSATNVTQAVITHINLSDGGVPKTSVPEALVLEGGIKGDRQKNLKYHGGPDRALCLWSSEIIAGLQAEGHPILPGSTGENITIAGIDWSILVPGVQVSLGPQVIVQITDYAAPCRTIAKSFKLRRYSRISQKHHPGTSRIYSKVLQVGKIQTGDLVAIMGKS